MPSLKRCTKCGEVKSLDDFHRNKSSKDGRRSKCKECARERRRQYYEENRDQALEWQRRYREENRDQVREWQRRYREENRDQVREWDRQYYEENREQVRERARRYYEENRDQGREQRRRYYEENREYHLERKRKNYEENQLSRAMATVPLGTAWTADEDAELLADDGRTIYQKAIDLGRTYAAAARRRERLLKASTRI